MKRVLVVNPFGIGDALFSLIAVESLKEAIPGAFVGFVGNERTEGLLRFDTSLDRTYVFNRDYFRSLWPGHPVRFFKELGALLSSIRKERYDTMLDFSLGREFAFFAMLAGIRARIGFDYKARGLFLTKKTPLKGYEDRPVADHQLDLLEREGIPVRRGRARIPFRLPSEALREATAFLEASGYEPSRQLVAAAPGGGKSWGANAGYKQWAPERFAEALSRWAAGKQAFVLLVGDASERGLLESVAARLSVPSAVAAGLPLETVSDLLVRAKFLLSNDGGLLHLANALGVPTVSIFGPVDPRVYGPYGSDTRHATAFEPVECRPCYRHFRFPACRYEKRCLQELSVEKVLALLSEMA